MAVDTEQVQETEATTEQAAAADSTTQTTEQEIPAADAADATKVADAADAVTEATTISEIPGTTWDPERQKRDQEKAEREAKRIADLVKKQVDEELARRGTTTTQTQSADELAQADALDAEARQLRAEASKLLREANLEGSADKADAADEKREKAAQLRAAHQRKIDERQRNREAQESQSASEKAALDKWLQDNPAYDAKKFIAARADAIEQAKDEGFTGPAIDVRMNQIMQPLLPTLKKSSDPAPKQPPKKTATATGTSVPPGTQVTPVNAGARPAGLQTGQAAKILGSILRPRSGK